MREIQKKLNRIIEFPIKCQTKNAENKIKAVAEKLQDHNMLGKISDIDLTAREAHYHPSCRKSYTRDFYRHKKSNANVETKKMITAHNSAFQYVCEHIDNYIIKKGNVERITMLKEIYLRFLQENHVEFYNCNYKTEKLKKKYGDILKFWQPNYKSELVYCSNISKGQAIEDAFEIASSEAKRLEEAALILRRIIFDSHTESTDMPWPPSKEYLTQDDIPIPNALKDFLSVLIGRKKSDGRSNVVQSISQDLCKAVTRRQWMMPKHLLLGMTIRHLTGSAEIVTMLHRFGHCASYSYILELETAISNKITNKEGYLPSSLHAENNKILHLCWDNFDLIEETLTGAGTTHSTHGIIIQEVFSNVPSVEKDVDLPRNKKRSITYSPQQLEPCFAKPKAEPVFSFSCVKFFKSDLNKASKLSDYLWILSRTIAQGENQTVPSWAGWVSITGNQDNSLLSKVEYMPAINAPITENSTVQEVLKISQAVTKEVNQKYTIITFDLAAAKKAYSIIWQDQHKFQNVIIRLGVFHTTCAYLSVIGKRMQSSGFEDILIQSGICASGSIEKVMSGKHYNRAMHVHKCMLEALERLFIEKYENSEGPLFIGKSKSILKRLSNSPSKESLEEVKLNEDCIKVIENYNKFKEEVRNGKCGKTAQFWLHYMDQIHLVLTFQRATKENNFELHLFCLKELCPLFFSYDHPNYARYTTMYLVSMLNLDKTHPGAEELIKHGLSVKRSHVNSSRNAVDITIEQTVNRHAKSKGGIIGFSRNYAAYMRWCLTRHSRATYVKGAMEMVEMEQNEITEHKDCRKSEIYKSEKHVIKTVEAFKNFINPFEVENFNLLYCISSGAPVSCEIEEDIFKADKLGKEAVDIFIKERFLKKDKHFNDPIKRQKLKTFASIAKSTTIKCKDRKTKQIKAERNILGQIAVLSIEHNLDIEKIMSHPLSPIPWALSTVDGTPAKTNKAKLLQALEIEDSINKIYNFDGVNYIIDGNALLHAQVLLPKTFGELAEKIIDQFPRVSRIDFITDSYQKSSIKNFERKNRGSNKPFLLKGRLTKVPRNWGDFMTNEDNKIQLIQFLLKDWKNSKFASRLKNKNIYYVNGPTCTRLTSADGLFVEYEEVEELFSTHEEADTKIILHMIHISLNTPTNETIIVRSPDTDVFILLLKFSRQIKQKLLFDTGTGNKRRFIDIHKVREMTGNELCEVLPSFHAFTGCDTVSAFVSKGKQLPLKLLKQNPEYILSFRMIGNNECISEKIYMEIEKFTCKLYQKLLKTESINKLRYDLFLQRYSPKNKILTHSDGIDMSLLPPCQKSLREHIKRANYQAMIWNSADKACPNLPSPNGHGWHISGENIEITWFSGSLMPEDLMEIVSTSEDNQDQHLENIEMNSFLDILYE